MHWFVIQTKIQPKSLKITILKFSYGFWIAFWKQSLWIESMSILVGKGHRYVPKIEIWGHLLKQIDIPCRGLSHVFACWLDLHILLWLHSFVGALNLPLIFCMNKSLHLTMVSQYSIVRCKLFSLFASEKDQTNT